MLPYFPFPERFDVTVMGARPYGPQDRLIETDDRYLAEVRLKRGLLARDHGFYYRAEPATLPAQWEVLALVLADLARGEPVLLGYLERHCAPPARG